jgi:alkanesulfonate monooxygenase SsuD/methylene tetrahydromethanopterin reductase-like flavin-dependent oxidoreductase (luciferase family)
MDGQSASGHDGRQEAWSEDAAMRFGASMFFTDYSMAPAELARALEERGFDILWAPEHSHIPLSRKTPFILGGALPKKYYDVMDPFVTLTAAAMATTTLRVGTGVCLVAQRDPIQTAKLVASIDQVSNGRFVFGVGMIGGEGAIRNGGVDLQCAVGRHHFNVRNATSTAYSRTWMRCLVAS